MASSWIEKRPTGGGVRYRVRFRLGGAESVPRLGGTFRTLREARARRDWVLGEMAAMRTPDVETLAEPKSVESLLELSARWQSSRKDIRSATALQHRTSLNHVNRLLGDRPFDAITREDVQRMVDALAGEGRARESIRKCRTALAMVLDFAGVSENAARDKRVKLPLREPDEVEPPHADHVEAVAWLVAPRYLLALLALDATGARVGELHAATVGDLDEERKAWLVRAKVSKTRRARWVRLPDDLFTAIVAKHPAREDRDPAAPLVDFGTTDALRVAIGRACRDAGVPVFSPHDLRHRRISLLHHQGESWAEIGAKVGQRNISTTADTYSHVLMDYRELDRPKLLERAHTAHTSLHTPVAETTSLAGTF